jgi:hypothetical protein
MKLNTVCASAFLLGAAAAAPAQVIFSDDFDANPTGLNTTPSGWTVANGTVDTVGPGFFNFYPGNGAYIDLDGSTSDAGVLSRSFSLVAGATYTASFVLGGSTRGDSNAVNVGFGSASDSFVLASSAAPASYALQFTPSADGSFSLAFANQGGDNLGALLLSVRVESMAAAIPEPQTYVLMMAGLAATALLARRRRRLG